MELKASTIVAVLASCLVLVQSYALPAGTADDGAQLSADKRPKYMETRDLPYFKDLLLVAIDELIAEGTINPNVLAEPKATESDVTADKRGRHLGICLQISPSGSYIPRPCWKREA